MTAHLTTDNLALAYGDTAIVTDATIDFPAGALTVIVGRNGCGKSTLLRGLARLIPPSAGAILLDGADLTTSPARTVARRLGMLPQQPVAPDGITVGELVGRGRHPHQRWFRQWSAADEAAVRTALTLTDTLDLVDRTVDQLSGGQKQRVWLALAIAQEPEVMLLDEPTTFLDLAHQLDILDVLRNLLPRTIIAVLHDLNLAARYADHLVAVQDGRVVAQGSPTEIVRPDLVADVFGVTCAVIEDPMTGTPLVVPAARVVRAA
ncbi:cobalamin/Fe3+-siderophore ABC transporter ATP-binding protein [Nocardia neocaledoniensis NBRC 108232]|uniref:Iron complex transport system ATP-binding protein n=1 Tax=Nocardia neocaledoniensis TaxID=236511 RepID=A0A317NG94_9NOCA|nr:ABC transporter ATP-binding protein [Nocardia neocaledoniensis]PWV74209.1 iron complex transport system ATP-binding protein [Nocardia neocaledoniensis]GEM33992.1 cobalamin/Fe3+-siderophore ABC transporter ATP-binding protein [Nocardia neocaledoniensis NBRC 108232]